MKAICTHDCQFRGVLVKADTVLDLTPEEAKTDQARSSFRPLEGDGPKKSEDKPDERGMTAADYRAKLDIMKVPYHPTDGVDALRKLFDRANDQTIRKGVHR
jgi:hypothetical protein